MKSYIVDTNILLDFPYILEKEDNLIILTDVLRELDGLKLSDNTETAFRARRAAVMISHNLNRVEWDDSLEKDKIPVDDKLILATQKRQAILLTNDVYLKVKAIIAGLETHGYGNNDWYNGVYYLYLNTENGYNKDLEIMMNEHKMPDSTVSRLIDNGVTEYENVKLEENQYLIVKDLNNEIVDKQGKQDYEVLAIFLNKNDELIPLFNNHNHMRIYNKWIDSIGPRNPEQICLFDALNRKTNSIISVNGGYGTGKSFILNNFAIQELEREKISKIVYVPNNAFTQDTMEIGALPGEILAKVEGQIGPLIDLVGIDQVQRWIEREQLEIVPMGFIRGRSFQNSIIIVNEAQNLTEDHIKLLIARCGENSRIFFDGDYKQTDSAIFKNKNGLKLLLNLHNSPIYSKIFANVRMKTIERSLTAQAATYLDENCGSFD